MKKNKRTFIPGEEWLFVKIYTGVKTADNILINELSKIVKRSIKSNIIDKWFFVRYTDPDFHLRVRFHLQDVKYTGDIMGVISEKLNMYINENIIWKIQYDTYKRELERYGANLIEDSETLFQINSDLTLDVLSKINNENYRWMISLKIMDEFLSAFNYSISQKKIFFETQSEMFKKEFGFNTYNSKQFNIKYREYKGVIENVLNDKYDDVNFLTLVHLIEKQNKRLILVAGLIIKKIDVTNNLLLHSFLNNHIHMALNRLFRSKNRKYELILYDFMKRYYISKMAKLKYS